MQSLLLIVIYFVVIFNEFMIFVICIIFSKLISIQFSKSTYSMLRRITLANFVNYEGIFKTRINNAKTIFDKTKC